MLLNRSIKTGVPSISRLLLFWVIGSVILLNSCRENEKVHPSFIVEKFDPISNYTSSNDTIAIDMDLSDAVIKGIFIPSDTAGEKYFITRFKIKNLSGKAQKFYYKVYFQNESYKHPETLNNDYNPAASRNFYGSWYEGQTGFHATVEIPSDGKFHEITDSIRIAGNPRNEAVFFGSLEEAKPVTEEEILTAISSIKNSTKWLDAVKQKAEKNQNTLEEQIWLDAVWTVANNREKSKGNLRWKRNPRAGVYGFLLAVTDENHIKDIPYYIRDISNKDTVSGMFINPYYYFNNPEENLYATLIPSKRHLKTRAILNGDNGIFINTSRFAGRYSDDDFNKYCGQSEKYYMRAHFEQFFHHIDKSILLANIPKMYDVVNGNYTREDYKRDSIAYANSLTNDYVKITDHPGRTVGFDPEKQALFLKTPGNSEKDEFSKENVGLRTRIGFTYGKITGKVRFPKIISDDYVWNGLTCAFWMIYQGPGNWNKRSVCESGYIPKSEPNKSTKRVKTTTYSEIDIEIVKTSKYWAESSYGYNPDYPRDDGLNNNVTITSTNWDLACKDSEHFVLGADEISYQGEVFYPHRWDKWYKAITTKYEYPQDKTLGSIFLYEIEWKPDEIIWRIGKDKEHMKVIGYLNDKYTNIPDNQMVTVITQEFHYDWWWPLAPFNQNFIPYPEKDIYGYVYEITIE